MVNGGTSPLVEPGLGELHAEVTAAGRLRATTFTEEGVVGSDLAMVCVGTPSRDNGQLDVDAIRRVAEEIGHQLRQHRRPYTVILRNTVLPGTTEARQALAVSARPPGGRSAPRLRVAALMPAGAVPGKPVRTRLRDSALQAVRFAGGLSAASRSRWRSRRLLILCYHGFAQADEHLWDSSLYVTQNHLESRLEFLAAGGYVILPLSEGLARLAAGTLPSRAVSITIDDGTYDFYAVAYPVLKRRGVPVTAFVSTTTFLTGARSSMAPANTCSGRPGWRRPSTGVLCWTKRFRQPYRKRLRSSLRTCVASRPTAGLVGGSEARMAWATSQRLGLDWDNFLRRRLLGLMHPEEIGALDPTVVDVQLHTHRHRVPEERGLFLREIHENRQALAKCGLDPTRLIHFCYPSGDYRPAFLPWLAEAGIASAVTCVPGLASSRHDRLLLPRFIDTGTTSEVEFEGWTSGVRQFLRRPGVPSHVPRGA